RGLRRDRQGRGCGRDWQQFATRWNDWNSADRELTRAWTNLGAASQRTLARVWTPRVTPETSNASNGSGRSRSHWSMVSVEVSTRCERKSRKFSTASCFASRSATWCDDVALGRERKKAVEQEGVR